MEVIFGYHVNVMFHFKYPFLYLLGALVAGILCEGKVFVPIYSLYLLLAAVSVCMLYKPLRHLTDLLLLGGFFLCGLHLTVIRPSLPVDNDSYCFQGECSEILPHHHYILTQGIHRFYLNHAYADTTFRPGDSLYFQTKLLSVDENSGYGRYLRQKGVDARLLPLSKVEQTGQSKSIRYYFPRLRQRLLDKNAALLQDSTALSLVNALTLGFRIDLDDEVQQLFVSTGTIHLLSVSGLHTGAIYLLLLFLLRQCGVKVGRQELIALPFLWAYACLTGLAPSVIRAATILTFMAVGKSCNQSYTPLNSIAASAFLTLLFRPEILLSPSFLMSYSAYTGIVLFYPLLYRYPVYRRHTFFSRIYACCCLTVSAQLLTIPISAFYFHSINLNGFLSNLTAVPFATVLLYASTFFMLLPVCIGSLTAPLIEEGCRWFIKMLQSFEPLMINLRDLYPTLATTLIAYLIIGGLYAFAMRRSTRRLVIAGGALCLLTAHLSFLHFSLSRQQEVVVFHHPRQSVVLLNNQGKYRFIHNSFPDSTKTIPYIRRNRLSPYPPAAGIACRDFLLYGSSLQHHRTTLNVASRQTPLTLPCDILVVTDKLLPEQVFSSAVPTYPQTVILDGSNSAYFLRRWASFCEEQRIQFRSTQEEGDIRIALK